MTNDQKMLHDWLSSYTDLGGIFKRTVHVGRLTDLRSSPADAGTAVIKIYFKERCPGPLNAVPTKP